MWLIHTGAQLRDGIFALTCDILDWDTVVVSQGGVSTVEISQGIPEGGLFGTLFYNRVPDSLLT